MSLKTKKEAISNAEKKIMDVSAEQFAAKGFEGTSTRDICHAAGANISSISYYFGGKKELYERVVERITGNIISYMMQSMGFDQSPPDLDKLQSRKKLNIFLEH